MSVGIALTLAVYVFLQYIDVVTPNVRPFGALMRTLMLLMGLVFLTQAANAACANPTGNAGDMTYSTSANVMAYCDSQNWISMAGGVSLTVNTSGGGVTPAGSSADVQFNSSGALAADTGNFTYSSGLLKAPNISTTAITASGAGNFGTINSSGLGTLGSLIVTGGATITGQASITTISTSLIQVGNNGANCTAALAGAQRYNSVSNTIDYCSGSAWLSLGPSATVVPAVLAYMSTDQTIAQSTVTVLHLDSKSYDTNNNFNTSTYKFTPTVPGYYIVNSVVTCKNMSAVGNACVSYIQKNGVGITNPVNRAAVATLQMSSGASNIVYMNGTTDYLQLAGYTEASGGVIGSGTTQTYLSAALLTMNGGGSGGSANPAGTTNDVQFNSSGLLAADTNNFTYLPATGTLSATTISTTVVNIASVSTIANVVGGSGNIISSGSTAVSTSSAGSITFYTGNSQRAVIDTNGNVGINATNPTGKLHIMQLSQGTLGLLIGNSTYSTAAFNAMGMQVNDSGQTIIRGGWSAAKDIILNDNGGGVLAGMSTAYTDGIIGLSPLQANAKTSGHAGITVKVESGAASTPMIGFANSNGTVGTISTNGSATAYNTSSDRRLKENIVTTREGLQKLMSIGVMDFNFRKDPSKTVVQGFIAQDLNKIYPEAVTVGDDGKDVKKQWQVDYGRITPLIVKAVQDLNIKTDGAVKSLKADNDNLRAELKAANDNIAELRKQVDALRRAR